MAKKWHKIIFFLVLAISSLLRLGGIYPSFPPYHSDEGMSYAQGISIIKENTLDAHGYTLSLGYPFLIPYINAFFFKFFFIPLSWSIFLFKNIFNIIDGIIKFPIDERTLNQIFQINILGDREIYVLTWGRIISAIIGIAVVIAVYFLSRKLFDKKLALIASLLVSINYRQVLNSHINLPDIYNSLFLVISLIFSFRLIKHRKKIDYLLAGVFVGVSIATKFHIYAAIGFLCAHFIYIIQNKESIKDVFSPKLLISVISGLIVFITINPYHFIHYEKAIEIIQYTGRKYGAGRYAFNFYPFWYLFNFGIGKITSIITILGAVMMFIKRPKIFFFLFAVTLSFFYVITYATNGGFYVRNFVTIIPIILIFPAYFLNSILNKKNKYTLLLFLLILTPMFFENFSKSIALVIDYSKPWNYKQIENWMTNIPKGSKIAAHPSVPLPTDSIRLEYNEPTYYSMEEFKEEGAEFSVTNLDWITNDYYDWMNNFNIIYAKKPVAGLESYYSAMATEELADYSIYNVFKSPFAPESNFIVEKIPSFNVSQKKLLKTYSNLNPGWKGEPIKVRNAKGIVVEGKIKNGYLFVNFYKYYTDIPDITKRIGTRVSSREKDIKFSNKNIISEIPKGATWAVVGFSQYKIADSKADDVKIFSADVKTDFSGFTVKKTEIPKDLLFPNSQGNL